MFELAIQVMDTIETLTVLIMLLLPVYLILN